MPNPLTLTPAAPATAAKPAVLQRHDGEAEVSTDFQGVLTLVTLTDSAGPGGETAVPTHADANIEAAEVDVEPVPDALAQTPPAPVEGAEGSVAASQINSQAPEVPVEAKMVHDKAGLAISQTESRADMPVAAQTQPAPPLIAEPSHANAPQKVELGVVGKTPLPMGTPDEPIPDIDVRHGNPQASATPVESPKPALPVHPPTVAQMQLTASMKSAETEDAPQVSESEGLNNTRSEQLLQLTRDIAPQPNAASAIARAEISRAIAGQMAAAITARPGSGAVEIALNPEELGRVSIIMNGRDDGLHLAIMAERPETLDLMRRHIAVLTTELQKLGFGDLSLDLGTPSESHQDQPDSQPGQVIETEFAEAGAPTYPQRSTPATGIDMRL